MKSYFYSTMVLHHHATYSRTTVTKHSMSNQLAAQLPKLKLHFSLARRPIYPRRLSRYHKSNFTSDEGNTSEYSVSPSSKNSTLESNSERIRSKSSLTVKRPSERSDGSSSSDSESDDHNGTVTTQIAFSMNKAESQVWNA